MPYSPGDILEVSSVSFSGTSWVGCRLRFEGMSGSGDYKIVTMAGCPCAEGIGLHYDKRFLDTYFRKVIQSPLELAIAEYIRREQANV